MMKGDRVKLAAPYLKRYGGKQIKALEACRGVIEDTWYSHVNKRKFAEVKWENYPDFGRASTIIFLRHLSKVKDDAAPRNQA
jgi:hypothetical protein